MKIYVASSWRNQLQHEVVNALRKVGHEVYDFKSPKPGDDGFRWSDVGLERRPDGSCTPQQLKEALAHPRAVEGFASDSGAMKWADACVLVLPCGRSAHLEAGWMAGAGRLTLVYAPSSIVVEPELMYGLTGGLCVSFDEVIARLREGK